MTPVDTGADETRPSSQRYHPTPSRDRAKARVRRWQRNYPKWVKQDSFGGKRLLALVGDGRARPYELGDLRWELRRVLSETEIAAIEWLIAVERGFGGNRGGLRVRHSTMAAILRCDGKTVQRTWHRLVELGLVDQRHWFRVRPGWRKGYESKRLETCARYVSTPRLRDIVEGGRRACRQRDKAVGQKRQPGGSQQTLRVCLIGVRGRARAFVESTLDRTQAAEREQAASEVRLLAERLAVRVVRQRGGLLELSDGRTMPVPDCSAALLAQKLRRRRERGEPVQEHDEALLAAWASFERSQGGGT